MRTRHLYSPLDALYKTMAITDSFGRVVTQARISLNSSTECNFSCNFCHKEGIDESNSHLLTPEEIQRITRIMMPFGIDRIKLTGGEPMLRRDISEIVERLNLVGVKETSITTNGTRLIQMAQELKDRGLSRVNISLHSLSRDRFTLITGVDRLSETLGAIRASIESGLLPVKMNTTVLRGVNDDEVPDMIEFSRSLGGGKTNVLQLIELVPTESRYFKKYHYSLDSIERDIKSRSVASTERVSHRRSKYELPNGVAVEVVRPVHNTVFCMGCNRIRITHDGKFKPCLLRRDNHIDFLTLLRRGAEDAEITEIFKRAVSLREPFFKHGGERLTEKARLPSSFEHTYA